MAKVWWLGVIFVTASVSVGGIIQQETVAPGVIFTTYSAAGPNNVFVVAIDRLRSEYKLKVGFSQARRNYTARERTSTICNRYDQLPGENVLAGINGSFIDTVNMPRMLGINQSAGEMLDTPALNPSFTYHTVMIGPERKPIVRTNFDHVLGTITFADGHVMSLRQYNFNMNGPYTPINNTVFAFTPGFDSVTPTDFSSSPSYAVEVQLSDVTYPMRGGKEVSGIITGLITPTNGHTPIPPGGMVLSTRGTTSKDQILAHAKLGERVRIRIATSAEEYNNSDDAITGIGWIIHNGTAYPAGWTNLESGAAPYSRHPRTVLAWNDTHWFMVVCDGRTSASVGMTFQEMADFLTGTLAAREAVNYDGGGSSTMVVKGAVRNVPSDGSERAIGNVLMLVKKDTATVFPFADPFTSAGRAPGWDDKFTYNDVVAFTPTAPGGDGHVLRVLNPTGAVETTRRGDFGDADYSVAADIYCEYRPNPGNGTSGREHYALFARDSGTGALGLTNYGKGNCYALVYDSESGRVMPGKYVNGVFTDFLASTPLTMTSTAWRRFRIDCQSSRIRYYVDDALIADVTDGTFASGYYGVGYQSFVVGQARHGTRAENFVASQEGALPAQAFNPQPAHEAVHVPLDSVLSWTAGAGAASHDVYLGTTSPGTFRGNQTDTTFDPGPLSVGTTYYWRIDEVNDNGTTTGTVWSFTTQYYLGDTDNDGDVDQEDFGLLQACLTNIGVAQNDPACDRAKLDADNDVDFEDVSLFIECFSGPNNTPPTSCLTTP
ncbi:MAG TPA: phosphodiester glycosidase family protein [Phycisphaerae bacterium]|nr:phosphodiester glycosidase family protein [Phycisphaerae bacterium]HOJ75994.1 phosphodiester glycosidase family protein [Phycisphaerae bacterium]HOM53411.1 phosphodiester glycosidase family protein [Phycisphaerae bacterium]HOQ86269.1 phosphodiester glycosidase family protein [Phycisphaerae bacterium]HPP28689.1 phosphodiester glycosidase family protein [Phycisphaerae bacterium]